MPILRVLTCVCVSVLFLACLGAAAPAQAREAMPRMTTVRVDMSAVMQGDSDALLEAHNAIVRAARRVCREPGSRSLDDRAMERACIAETVEQTIARVHVATLSRYYAGLAAPERIRVHREPDARALASLGQPYDVMFAAEEASQSATADS